MEHHELAGLRERVVDRLRRAELDGDTDGAQRAESLLDDIDARLRMTHGESTLARRLAIAVSLGPSPGANGNRPANQRAGQGVFFGHPRG